MNQKTYGCPGCSKPVKEYSIKNHITNCTKYQNSAFFYTKAIKLSESDKTD